MAKQNSRIGRTSPRFVESVELKSVIRARQDIRSWNIALQMAKQLENPRWYRLQQLYDEIFLDALLQSQYKNRVLSALATRPILRKPNGDVDEEQTELLSSSIWAKEINRHILDSNYRAISLIEFSFDTDGELKVDLIPRENLNPRDGVFYPDYTDDQKIYYREASEFGTWLLEFHEKGNDGLFNSAVPHVLFKRFAESCWSELCEINGIPPRVLKTNTQDPVMMRRGEQMMREMGAAAWFIIDQDENFEWAQAATQSGDVYKNLINLCNNEISMLISGAIIGQDTEHGGRAKDESAQVMLNTLIENDLDQIERYWNNDVIPALQAIGVIKGDVIFEFEQNEDTAQLFEWTKGFLQSGKNVDDEWIQEKFGVMVTGDKTFGFGNELKLKDPDGLFI